MRRLMLLVFGVLAATTANAWQGKITNVLQHGTMIAIYLSPDPGPGSLCTYGSPYLMQVDDTPAGKQRFAMIMMALATGQTVSGYDDGCDTSIWGQLRPLVLNLQLNAN